MSVDFVRQEVARRFHQSSARRASVAAWCGRRGTRERGPRPPRGGPRMEGDATCFTARFATARAPHGAPPKVIQCLPPPPAPLCLPHSMPAAVAAYRLVACAMALVPAVVAAAAADASPSRRWAQCQQRHDTQTYKRLAADAGLGRGGARGGGDLEGVGVCVGAGKLLKAAAGWWRGCDGGGCQSVSSHHVTLTLPHPLPPTPPTFLPSRLIHRRVAHIARHPRLPQFGGCSCGVRCQPRPPFFKLARRGRDDAHRGVGSRAFPTAPGSVSLLASAAWRVSGS